MCQACDAYDEVMEVLQTFDLTNDQGVQLLANLVLTFTGEDPAKAILLLSILNGRVVDILVTSNETRH